MSKLIFQVALRYGHGTSMFTPVGMVCIGERKGYQSRRKCEDTMDLLYIFKYVVGACIEKEFAKSTFYLNCMC